jgi:hypothetical protein
MQDSYIIVTQFYKINNKRKNTEINKYSYITMEACFHWKETRCLSSEIDFLKR